MKLFPTYTKLLIESIDGPDDYFEMLSSAEYEILSDIKDGKTTSYNRINPSEYHQALKQLVKFGDVTMSKFPTKKIFVWKRIMMENTAMLNAYNALNGHSENGVTEEFHMLFNGNNETQEDRGGEYDQWLINNGEDPRKHEYDWNSMFEFLDEVYNVNEVIPKWSNGHDLISDYGLKPLEELVHHLSSQQDPNKILVDINKMLDITHPRSDIAELFIVGGSASLDFIAGFHKDDD